MKASHKWNMGNHDSKTALRFNFLQLSFKPLELMTWISSVLKEPPVKIVTSLHVDTNNVTFVTELERFSVVSIFDKNFLFVLIKPVGIDPAVGKVVNFVISFRSIKILDIYWPSVMISLNGVNLNIGFG